MNEIESFMNWWQGIILGILQGVTEYLPVSSSGHLAIAERIFGLHMPVSVDVLLHLATLIPTIWIFRQKIASLLHSLGLIIGNAFRPSAKHRKLAALGANVPADARYIALILVVTFFTFWVAFPQKDLDLKFRPLLIASLFLFTALLLLLQHFLLKQKAVVASLASDNILLRVSWRKAIILAACIGLAQGVAALPGVSRSGMTISVALLLGVPRRDAGEFSFIISIPIILGALLLDAKELISIIQIAQGYGLISIVLAFTAACLSGFVALRLLLKLLDKGNFYIFSIYLILLSAFSFLYFG